MVFKLALLVMIVFLNSATDGKYLLVKLEAELANKGFESRKNCRPHGSKYISSNSYICGDYRYNKSNIFPIMYLKPFSFSASCSDLVPCCSGTKCTELPAGDYMCSKQILTLYFNKIWYID